MICPECQRRRTADDFEPGQQRCMLCRFASARLRYANSPRTLQEVTTMWERAIASARKRAQKRAKP